MEATRSPYLKHLYVCVNRRDPGVTCCAPGGVSGAASASGSHAAGGRSGFAPSSESHALGGGEAILEKLKAFVKANGLKGKARVSRSGCMDLCAQGPNVMVYPDYRWYHHVTLEDVDQIIEEHLAPLMQNEIATLPSVARNDEGVPSPAEGEGGSARNGIGAFLFDLGNVLVRFDHLNAARQIAEQTRVAPEELFRLFFDSPLVIEHDTGKISTRTFYKRLKEKWRINVSFEEFLLAWNGIFTPDPEAIALVRELMKRYPCHLISNTNRPHFEHCRASYPILNDFSGWILSFEVGVLKPHPAIYQRALEIIGLPPHQVFYVDDRLDLVEAAQALGFVTHRFTEASSLQQELLTIGV